MKTKEIIVIAPEGCHKHFTPGKEYKVLKYTNNSFNVISDTGRLDNCLWKNCAHLNYQDWIIKKDRSSIEIPLKFWLYLTGFISFFLFIAASDYLFGKLAYLIAEKQNFVIQFLIGLIIGIVITSSIIKFKKLSK